MALIKAAGLADVKKGRGTYVVVNGQELALFNIDGTIFCIENHCPHMDGPLSEGEIEGDVVYCPWHFWPVNVRTGEVPYDPGLCTKTFACTVTGDEIFVEI